MSCQRQEGGGAEVTDAAQMRYPSHIAHFNRREESMLSQLLVHGKYTIRKPTSLFIS